MKKLIALVLALAMVLMVGAAFAAALPSGTAGDVKTITISSPTGAQSTDEFTYTVYKVFDAVSNASGNISYKLLSGASAPSGFTVDDAGNVYLGTVSDTATGASGEIAIKVGNATKYLTPQTTDLTDAQITAIKNYSSKTEVGTVTITGYNTVTVTVPDYGYYYIETTTGTVVTINSTAPAATVVDKNTVPSLDKDIASVAPVNSNGSHTGGADNEASESATASIGDTVNYSVNITAQKGAIGYVYHDTLSAGLTLVTDTEPVVTVGSTTLTKGNQYTLTKFANNTPANGSAENITITFSNDYLATITQATTINIAYSAIVNENAVIAGTGNKNTGKLEYGRSGSTNFTPDDEPKVYVFEFQLVKDNASKTILTGAEFKLYTTSACTTEIPVIDLGNGNYKVKDSTSTSTAASVIAAGKPVITGLGNGTYYLKETKAPDGYNLLPDPVPVTIDDANNNATLNQEQTTYTSGGVEVVNQQGATLPSTGGIGTTIFYILGGLLVIGAAVILVARRKAHE